MATGMLIAYAVCAGLYHRERTGKGQLIDTALFATMLCLQSGILFFGEIHRLSSMRSLRISPPIAPIATLRDNSSPWPRFRRQWRRLCRVADVPDIADPRFDSLHKRVNNAEELIPLLQHKFAQHPRQHWITTMNEQQIPSGPVYSHDDLRQRRQGNAFLPTMQHPVAGAIQFAGLPVVFHDSPPVSGCRRPCTGNTQRTFCVNTATPRRRYRSSRPWMPCGNGKRPPHAMPRHATQHSRPLAASAPLWPISQDGLRGVMPWRTGHLAAGVRPGATEIEPRHWRAVLSPARQRSAGKHLLGHNINVANVAIGEPNALFEVHRREQLPVQQGRRKFGA